jgi:hypothetical protein
MSAQNEKPVTPTSTTAAEEVAMNNKEDHLAPSETEVGSELSENDELSPKNWSKGKKLLLFISLMSASILCDG